LVAAAVLAGGVADSRFGNRATYYPESNPLLALHHVADGSNQPASKSIVVSFTPSS